MLAFLVISQLSFSSGNAVCSVAAAAAPLTPFVCFGDMTCEEMRFRPGWWLSSVFEGLLLWSKRSSFCCLVAVGGFSVHCVFRSESFSRPGGRNRAPALRLAPKPGSLQLPRTFRVEGDRPLVP